MSDLRIEPVTGALGAEVLGADLAQGGAQFVNITTQTLLGAGVRHWKERLDETRPGT